MVDVPWESEESRNYICIQNIVTNVVSKGLRIVFKREWNFSYQARFGAWDDTSTSGGQLFHKEKARKRPNKNVYQSKFQHGNTNQWDSSVLFDAILYSNSIGSTLNTRIKTEVDKLRIIRNKIMHSDEATLTDAEFQNITSDVENAFKALALPKLFDNVIGIKSKRNLYKSFQILPPKPTHLVVNRSEKINEIKQDLQKLRNDNKGKLTYFYITGNPGSGKSQLSRQLGEYLTNHVDWQENSAFVMTLNAENLESLLYSYADFCRHLNCNENVISSVMNSSNPKEQKIKDLRSQLTKRIRNWKLWWIIVDNVKDLRLISPLLPLIGDEIWNNGQIIVTIQNTISVPSNSLDSKHISLSGGMNQQECRQLLSSLSDTDTDDPLLDEVADKLDRQPLAMAAAAVYVKQLKEKEFSWHNYIEKLEKGKRQVTEKRLQETNLSYSSTMSSAVLLALQKSTENNFILNETFNLFSLISFESLPIDIIIKYIQQLDQNFEKEDIYLAIKHCSLFLLTGNENDVRMHRVVHEATETLRKRDRVYEVAGPNHIDVATSYNNLGLVYQDTGELQQAKDYLQHAMNIRIHVLGPNHIDVATSYNNLGMLYEAMGELEQAKDYLQLAMDIKIKVLGPNHIKVATSYNCLGLVYHAMGELEQAKDYHQRAMNIKIKVLDPNHINVAKSYNNLGLVYQDTGELEQAKDYLQRAMDIKMKVLGPNHIEVATSYNNLGVVYKAMGELEHAKDYLQRAMDIEVKVLGPNHIDVAASYSNLGYVYNAMGELEQAKDYHQQAMDIKMKVLGPNHIDVAISYNNLGLVYQDMGGLEQAKNYLQRAMDIKMKVLGPNHIDVAISYNNLGLAYQDTGELEQAKDYLQRAMDIKMKVLGPNHIDVAKSYNNLGLVYKDMGELEQAKDYLQQAMNIKINVLGPNHIDVATSYNNLGLVYQDMGELEQAKNYLQRAMDIEMKVLGPNNIKLSTSYNNLGMVYQDTGELEQAKDYLQQAMNIKINVLGPNHIDVATSYNNLGLVYKAMGELEQAKDYLQRAMDIDKKVLGQNHIDVATSYNNLGLVYKAMGELEQAKDYLQ